MTEKISNFETSPAKEREIIESNKIPPELMAKRMDFCARREGLRNGFESSEEEIKKVLDQAGFKIEERTLPPSIQLYEYLQEKYRNYVWRGTEAEDSKDIE